MDILILDDEIFVRDFLESYFHKKGYKFFSVDNPQNALEILDKKNIDLLITDIKMPSMTGLEMLKKIRRVNLNIVVVMITGYSNENTAIEALNAGANYYLRKPIKIEDLDKIVELVERQLYMKKRNHDLFSEVKKEMSNINFVFGGFLQELSAYSSNIKGNIEIVYESLSEIDLNSDWEEEKEKYEIKLQLIKEAVKKIMESSYSMDSDINFMRKIRELDFSHEYNVSGTLREIVENVKLILGEKIDKIKFMVNYRAERDDFVIDDVDMIKILIQLIGNAIDSIMSSKRYEEGVVEVDFISYDNGLAVIEVADNGRGIPDNYKSRIFLPFFSTSNSEKSGIGLFYLFNLIDRYNGFIEVESEVGKGARFIVGSHKDGEKVRYINYLDSKSN